MNEEFRESISSAKIRLRSRSPYFAVLLGHMIILELPDDVEMPTARTDSVRLWINEKFWRSLSPEHREFVLAHEVLHAALGHCWRIGSRLPLLWNVACDYVDNLILEKAQFSVLSGSLLSKEYAEMTAEEVYDLLLKNVVEIDFVPGLGGDIVDASQGGDVPRLEATWRMARAAAKTAEQMYGQGSTPVGEIIDVVLEDPRFDWEDHLWRTLDPDRTDFTDWDRRLLHSGTYVEDLQTQEGISRVAVCVDTSGSVLAILGKFAASVKALAALFDTDIPVYWDDAALVGPVPISEIDKPIGGGGTSFVPFFEEVERMGYERVVYLTDLMGEFPAKTPEAQVLWVVPSGTSIEPPFGKVAVMLEAE